jgi:hypothetical protein
VVRAVHGGLVARASHSFVRQPETSLSRTATPQLTAAHLVAVVADADTRRVHGRLQRERRRHLREDRGQGKPIRLRHRGRGCGRRSALAVVGLADAVARTRMWQPRALTRCTRRMGAKRRALQKRRQRCHCVLRGRNHRTRWRLSWHDWPSHARGSRRSTSSPPQRRPALTAGVHASTTLRVTPLHCSHKWHSVHATTHLRCGSSRHRLLNQREQRAGSCTPAWHHPGVCGDWDATCGHLTFTLNAACVKNIDLTFVTIPAS